MLKESNPFKSLSIHTIWKWKQNNISIVKNTLCFNYFDAFFSNWTQEADWYEHINRIFADYFFVILKRHIKYEMNVNNEPWAIILAASPFSLICVVERQNLLTQNQIAIQVFIFF